MRRLLRDAELPPRGQWCATTAPGWARIGANGRTERNDTENHDGQRDTEAKGPKMRAINLL